MSNFSSITGPAIVQTVNTQAVLGSPSSTLGSNGSALFNNSLSVTLPTGTTNDWNPPNFVPGVTNFLQITPVGTPTLNGINTSGMAPGFTFLLYNASSSGSITIGNLTGSLISTQCDYRVEF